MDLHQTPLSSVNCWSKRNISNLLKLMALSHTHTHTSHNTNTHTMESDCWERPASRGRLVTKPDAEARVHAVNQTEQANASWILMCKGRDENVWDLRCLPSRLLLERRCTRCRRTMCFMEQNYFSCLLDPAFIRPASSCLFPASSNLSVLPLIYSLSHVSAWTKTSNLRCPSVFILKANTAAVVLQSSNTPVAKTYHS